MSDKKLADYFKKIDFSDLRILLIGVVLLIIPLIFLLMFSGSGKTKKFSQQRIKTMVNRKSIFNFGNQRKDRISAGSSATTSQKKTGGWFGSESPEKKVQRELEEAMKIVQRSRRNERFPPGISREQREAYRAEHNPYITDGNGELERGNLAEAEKLFLLAYEEGKNNVFQQVYAIGGLLEVYSRMKDQKKYEEAFKIYMELVGKLPKDFGGGDLQASVRDFFLTLKQLKDAADPAKVSLELNKLKLVKDGTIPAENVSRGLSRSLAVFPAKFD
ncbi:MAG: hypothetical protein Kow0029_05940 [Candidatus Rifleibacteriota bacterium]